VKPSPRPRAKGAAAKPAPEAQALSVGMAQMEIHPGEPSRNAAAMRDAIAAARGRGIDLLVFPEMCLPGYLLGDMWERPAFIKECEALAQGIVAATSPAAGARGDGGMAVVFGSVFADWNAKGEDGRPRKFNGYVVAQNGKALIHPGLKRPYGIKTLLPNYREFEEPRHFHDTRKLALETGRPLEKLLAPFPLRMKGKTWSVGVILCEDAWEDDYAQKPLEILAGRGCDFLVNLSCSPFTQGKNQKRNRLFSQKARKLGLPLFYVNAVSLQNNGKTLYTFDGRSTAYGADGAVIAELPAFRQETSVLRVEKRGKKTAVALPEGAPARAPKGEALPEADRIREIHEALRYGARKFLMAMRLDRVVVGISGGIDSAVAAALYREILPPENILLINMPSRFNSGTTRGLARALAVNLGCPYAEIGIEGSLEVTKAQLDGLEIVSPDGGVSARLSLGGQVWENVQARDRSSRILAAAAAGFGGVFTCNANKAELTVGYSTLYGDLGGFLALIGDLWKSEVYALGRRLNEVYGRDAIPEGVFSVVPSAELSFNQAVDEGKGDPLLYPYHDRLFFSWVQRWNRATPEEILEWYRDGSLAEQLGCEADPHSLFPDAASFIRDLERWWDLYNGIGVAKRVQAPPILAVSSRAFGFDHREALGTPFYSSRYFELKKKLLEG
jgi:NAD+ synthase (glutamine-hydrolysing)